jgi:phage-related protein
LCLEARDKPIVWLSGEVKTPPFSLEARVETGVLLRQHQRGEKLSLPQSRPMPQIGAGCHELRVDDAHATWRLVYFVDSDCVVVLGVFGKKTKRTPTQILLNCRRRLREYRLASGE